MLLVQKDPDQEAELAEPLRRLAPVRWWSCAHARLFMAEGDMRVKETCE